MANKLNNDIDNHVDKQIIDCINPSDPKSFFLFAGAGSGKTRSLVNALKEFKKLYGDQFRLKRQRVAIITYTNAAAGEITHRLDSDPIFQVSTIHSFAWILIKPYSKDIKIWLKQSLVDDISALKEEQGKSRNLKNKTSIDRAKKIESKTNRLNYLDNIIQFTYNPNGDNTSKDSLNHSEVISIAASFIAGKVLMQNLLVCKYPILFIDESQDTKRELIDAFFRLQQNKKDVFCLGLFGDTMQRIYMDGKENLGRDLPVDWIKPVKKMNHRSNKRIINLINNIRESIDNQKQESRNEKEEGIVRFFICARNNDKVSVENLVIEKMENATQDALWNLIDGNIKTLILEHHMAANRMGFLDFFRPLYEQDKLKTSLLDGTLASANFFTQIVLPLVEANAVGDKFAIARIVKKNSKLLRKDELLKNKDETGNIVQSRDAVTKLLSLWNTDREPLLIEILREICDSGLFPIPEMLAPIAYRTEEEIKLINNQELGDSEDVDPILDAWDIALKSPFSQIRQYAKYLSEDSTFGTHQGVKGLEYS